MKKSKLSLAAAASFSAMTLSSAATASPRGSEFDTSLTPAAGGMAGVSIARPQDPVAMLFSNPASLSQLEGSNAFTIGASFVWPDLNASGPATDLFGGPPNMAPLTGDFEGSSRLVEVAAPHAAFLQRINEKLVVGVGLTAVSGLGGDYRNVENIPNLVSDLKIFGTNMSFAYEITDNLSFGGTATLGIGALQVSLSETTSSVNNFGIGGSLGLTYDADVLVIGAAYKFPLNIEYEQVIQTGPDVFSDLELEQPDEIQFGIATGEGLFEDTVIAVDLRYKRWSDAQTYQDLWDDQFHVAFGIQHELDTPLGPVALRGGYSWSSSIVLDEPRTSFGTVTEVNNPFGDGTLPVTPTFVDLARATLANGYWRHGISGGLGVPLAENIRLDMNIQYVFDGEAEIGPFETDSTLLSAGFGITWAFDNR